MDVNGKVIEVKMNGTGQGHPRQSTIFCKTLDTLPVSVHVKFHQNLSSFTRKLLNENASGLAFPARHIQPGEERRTIIIGGTA